MREADARRSRCGRPPALTHEDVARAVLEIGFPKLTFAAVRERLGVAESTVFRYARDRDVLVRLALDHAIEQTEWPPLTGPWREVLESSALAAWHAWEAHPGAATEAARGIVPVGVMRRMDDLCAMLMRQGFTVHGAVLACDTVFDLVNDNRRGVEHFDAIVPGAGPGRDHLHDLWSGIVQQEPAEHAATEAERSQIHAEIRAAILAAPIDWFAAKLEIVLDGIERTLAPGAERMP